MTVPTAVTILKQGGYLIASVQAALTDADLVRLRDQLSERVGRYRSRAVIVDVGGLDVLDSFAARMLMNLGQVVRLRGAELVIVGIRPDVASTMACLGIDLRGAVTALDLDEGLEYLDGRIAASGHHGD